MKNKTAQADHDAVVIDNVMKATGLSEAQVRELLLMGDDDLDSLCDAALSDLSETPTKAALPKR